MGKKDKTNPLEKAKTNPLEKAKKGTSEEPTTVKKKGKALVDAPAGDMFSLADNLGALVLIDPQEYEADFVTENGATNIIRGDVTVLTEDDGKTKLDEPTEYHSTIIFGTAVVASLRSVVGKSLVIGVVAQGVKKAGKNPPWILEAASPKQRKIAEDYIENQ